MASWQASAFSFLLRQTFKRKLRRSIGNVAQLRSVMSVGRYPVPDSLEIIPATLGGVAGEWVQPRGRAPAQTMLYLHGGGYFACSPRTHRPVSCWFASAGLRVFVPDYRLAPEHPYPAAVEDAQAVWAALLGEFAGPEQLVVAGDSAGGGLALALMLAERDAGRPLPRAAALFSPWTDLAVSGESVAANERSCAMFTADGIRSGAAMYLGGTDARDPLASPLYADLRGLPPLLIHVSDHEALRDDSLRLAERAREQGVTVSCRRWDRVPHTWQLFHKFIPEGRDSLREASHFAHDHLS